MSSPGMQEKWDTSNTSGFAIVNCLFRKASGEKRGFEAQLLGGSHANEDILRTTSIVKYCLALFPSLPLRALRALRGVSLPMMIGLSSIRNQCRLRSELWLRV